jgi:hypothetical protein
LKYFIVLYFLLLCFLAVYSPYTPTPTPDSKHFSFADFGRSVSSEVFAGLGRGNSNSSIGSIGGSSKMHGMGGLERNDSTVVNASIGAIESDGGSNSSSGGGDIKLRNPDNSTSKESGDNGNTEIGRMAGLQLGLGNLGGLGDILSAGLASASLLHSASAGAGAGAAGVSTGSGSGSTAAPKKGTGAGATSVGGAKKSGKKTAAAATGVGGRGSGTFGSSSSSSSSEPMVFDMSNSMAYSSLASLHMSMGTGMGMGVGGMGAGLSGVQMHDIRGVGAAAAGGGGGHGGMSSTASSASSSAALSVTGEDSAYFTKESRRLRDIARHRETYKNETPEQQKRRKERDARRHKRVYHFKKQLKYVMSLLFHVMLSLRFFFLKFLFRALMLLVL